MSETLSFPIEMKLRAHGSGAKDLVPSYQAAISTRESRFDFRLPKTDNHLVTYDNRRGSHTLVGLNQFHLSFRIGCDILLLIFDPLGRKKLLRRSTRASVRTAEYDHFLIGHDSFPFRGERITVWAESHTRRV